ncbi:helix-turn-helix domain-containing protein [Paenibacillus taichungensis]
MLKDCLEASSPQDIYTLMFLKFPDVVNVMQMCDMLGGISTKSAYKLLQSNQIDYFKIGRSYKIPKVNIIVFLHRIMNNNSPLYYDALLH